MPTVWRCLPNRDIVLAIGKSRMVFLMIKGGTMAEYASNRKVLIIEDSELIGKKLQDDLQRKSRFKPVWARTLSAGRQILDQENIFVALVDYCLPDAMNGEAISEVTRRKVPTIVFTGQVDDTVREKVWQSRVVDYVLKDHIGSFDYMLNMLDRLERNQDTSVMVVDDTRTFRTLLSNLLNVHLYHVIEAVNGEDALEKLEDNPSVKLVLSDYHMPEMDGFTLCYKIRERFQNRIAIIGISSGDDPLMAARFIKSGANDFITKHNFIAEEFYGRVTQCVDSIHQMELIQDVSVRDFMTNLHNRRYFFEVGRQLFANARREKITIVCAIIDIDYFKQVNDTWGHDVGDQVICAVSEVIRNHMRDGDIVARLGGEEFGVLAVNMNRTFMLEVFERVRREVEDRQVVVGTGNTVRCTVSIGVSSTLGKSLEEMLQQADKLLYQAKNSGRNKIAVDKKD